MGGDDTQDHAPTGAARDADGDARAATPRRRVERAGGKARRARLTPAPGSDPSPEAPVEREATPRGTAESGSAKRAAPRPSADDERLTRDRPPHWRRD